MSLAEERFLYSEDGTRQYKYFAFISYKHYDMLWGMWLQWQLEGYRLPIHLCGNEERPQRLTPIFRDGTDLTSGGTTDELLLEKLSQSKYLIIICSKNMQRNPYWINREIEHFLQLGNPVSRIIPFVVNGQGCARDPREEAFPPALLALGERIPHGITVSPFRLHDAVLKLVAAIHRIDLQSIRTHDQVRRQRNRLVALGIGMIASLSLAAFMAWEVLSVKQAQLSEQNVYAANVFNLGDRRKARIMAKGILDQVAPFMEERISADAVQTNFLASLEPLLSPVTLLETAFSNTSAQFTCTGDRVIVSTEEQIHIYDLEGNLLNNCPVSNLGQKFVAISPDGEYAVSLAVLESHQPYIELWLCSVSDQTRLVKLVDVHAEKVSQNEASAGQYQALVDAVFSSDGKMVAAYRTGGYYNSSDVLQVYSLDTHEPIVTLDAELLGSNGQGFVIEDFEFLSDSLFHWTGPLYHVFYDTQLQKSWQVPLRDVATNGRGKEAYGYLNATLRREDNSSYVLLKNLANGGEEELFFENAIVAREDCQFFHGKFLLLIARNSDGNISQARIVDMDTLQLLQQIDVPAGVLYTNASVLTSEDRSTVYFSFSNTEKSTMSVDLFHMDLTKNNLDRVLLPDSTNLTGEIQFVGTAGGADWLLGSCGYDTLVLRIKDGSVSLFTINEQYTVFAQAADISPEAEMLVAVHNDSYALCPLTNPGTQIDSSMQWQHSGSNVFVSVSGDGETIVKAQGNQFALFAENQCVCSGITEYPIQAVSITEAGDRFLCADEQALYLYQSDGVLLKQYILEEDSRIWDARFIPNGSRILLAEADDIWSYPSAGLRLLDGETLKEIQYVCEVYKSNGVSIDVIGDVSRDPLPQFTVSDDSNYFAAVNLIYYYYNGDGSMKMKPQYQRVVSIFSAEDGKLLAQGPVGEENAVMLDMSQNLSQAVGFHYVNFAQSGKLLASFSSGFWVIDPVDYSTSFIPVASQAVTEPEQLANGILCYPGDELQLIDANTGSHVSTFAVNSAFEIQLSVEGNWIAVTDCTGTWILSTMDIADFSVLSNQPVDVVYIDETQIIYNSPDGLYKINISL